VLAKNLRFPVSLKVDGDWLYWTNAGSVTEQHMDGSVMKVAVAGGTPVVLAPNQPFARGLVLDDTNAYWITDSAIMTVAK
jgi:hypothetical protein